MIFYHINVCTYLWLPQFQGHLSNFKVIEAENLLKHVKFQGSGHFLENTNEKKIEGVHDLEGPLILKYVV